MILIFIVLAIFFAVLWLKSELKHDSFIASLYRQEVDRFWEDIRKAGE